MAMLGEDGFRVKLHAFDVEFSMAHAHNLAIVGPGGDFQTRRATGPLNRQRVVAVDGELFRQTRKNAFLLGGDDAGLAMHQFLCPNDMAAKGCANALVPQAHPQKRQLACKVLDGRHRDAGLDWRARARRNHQAVRLTRCYAFQGDFVVAKDFNVSPQLAKVLHDVEGERVVVVDHQEFDFFRHDHSKPSSTNSLARSKARALCSVSRHSISGTESATTPAAACTYSVWSLMTAVRMAMATSMSPA